MSPVALALFRAKAYIQHRLSARTRYGVHSPFVYWLLESVRQGSSEPATLREYRRYCATSRLQLPISDYGAGPTFQALRKPTRPLARVAATSGSTPHKTRWLRCLIEYLQPNEVLELGTNLGIGTMAMLYTLPLSSKLTSLEGAPLLAEFAEKQLRERVHPKAHFQVITTRFSDWMINHPDARPEFVFLDGDHTEAATTANGSWFLDRIPAGGALVVDDIYWSPGMARAWRSLKAHPRVSVWVDAFHLGILFVERQQAREGFCVRV